MHLLSGGEDRGPKKNRRTPRYLRAHEEFIWLLVMGVVMAIFDPGSGCGGG